MAQSFPTVHSYLQGMEIWSLTISNVSAEIFRCYHVFKKAEHPEAPVNWN